MRSKAATVRRQTPVRERFSAVVVTSASVFAVEAAVGVIALAVRSEVHEHPGAYEGGGPLLYGLLLGGPVAFALGALLSAGVVMPVLVAAEWLRRRFGRRGTWWLVPALAALVAAPLAVPVGGHFSGGTTAGVWLTATLTLTVPALIARRLLLPDRPHLTGGTMFWRVASYGTLTVTVAAVLGVQLGSTFAYEPPQLSSQRTVGRWEDGKDGVLVLAADGTAKAMGVRAYEDISDPYGSTGSTGYSVHTCTGDGTWAYRSGTGRRDQQVSVSIPGCALGPWDVLGTPAHPELYVYIGDPDAWDLSTLRRVTSCNDHAPEATPLKCGHRPDAAPPAPAHASGPKTADHPPGE